MSFRIRFVGLAVCPFERLFERHQKRGMSYFYLLHYRVNFEFEVSTVLGWVDRATESKSVYLDYLFTVILGKRYSQVLIKSITAEEFHHLRKKNKYLYKQADEMIKGHKNVLPCLFLSILVVSLTLQTIEPASKQGSKQTNIPSIHPTGSRAILIRILWIALYFLLV